MCNYNKIEIDVFTISQATNAALTDIYFHKTCLFFIQKGEKHVMDSEQKPMIGYEGDLIIFSTGSIVTMENHPVINDKYQATGMAFPQHIIDDIFLSSATQPQEKNIPHIQIIDGEETLFSNLLSLIHETVSNPDLPDIIKNHRLREPLIWLRDMGYKIPTKIEDRPTSKLRHLLETDLSYKWSAKEAANHFGMSEATMRRWLAKDGHNFSKILHNMRLEYGLALLQTTDMQISQIAFESGFKTPSHFSDSFRKRFKFSPKEIRFSNIVQ